MHQPRPYGFSVVGGVPTQNDYNLILQLVRQLTNAKQVSDLESLKIVRDLPDGGSVIVQDMGGIFKVIVNKPTSSLNEPFDGIAKTYIPMLFSGTFKKLTFNENDRAIDIKLTEICRRRLSRYIKQDKFPVPQELRLERFAVEYPQPFRYLKPSLQGEYFKHTQYMRIKPTMYSGAMGELVQIVSGYGIPYQEKFVDTQTEYLENAEMTIPDDWFEKIVEEIDRSVLPGYTGIPHSEGFLQYDYKALNNHLVSFDSERNPWLVLIKPAGVFAMPLPVVPATTTKAFLEYLEEMGDDELLKILDRFGGLPSGESFPEGKDFECWKRAGVIIKVCETSDFYDYQPLFFGCGWSINSRGTEGFNTCYGYRNDGLMEVHGYKLRLNLGVAKDRGTIGPKNTDASAVYRYISNLYKLLVPGEGRSNSIIYKIRRSEFEDLERRAALSDGDSEDEVNYWDNLQMEPIALHEGNVARTTSGPVYWPNPNIQSMGRLKFPTMLNDGCESLILYSEGYTGGFVKCDTVMFGAYIDDQLRTVKYFYDERTVKEQDSSTFDDVMIVGQWEKSETTSYSGLQGYFYTTDYDDRRLKSPSSKHTNIVGSDLGYGNPLYVTPGLMMTHGHVSRSRYYKHRTTETTIAGDTMDCAICVPVFNRDCLLYVEYETTQYKYMVEYDSQGAVGDPTSYSLWTYDPLYHWIGGRGPGDPQPTIGEHVYVYGPRYSPTSKSDFADSGDWLGIGNGYMNVDSICAQYTHRNSVHSVTGAQIGGEAPQIKPYSISKVTNNEYSGKVCITYGGVGAVSVHTRGPEAGYFNYSPQIVGDTLFYFYRDACRVLFGDTTYANISDENSSSERRIRWGYSNLVDHTQHHYFFGVINE